MKSVRKYQNSSEYMITLRSQQTYREPSFVTYTSKLADSVAMVVANLFVCFTWKTLASYINLRLAGLFDRLCLAIASDAIKVMDHPERQSAQRISTSSTLGYAWQIHGDSPWVHCNIYSTCSNDNRICDFAGILLDRRTDYIWKEGT